MIELVQSLTGLAKKQLKCPDGEPYEDHGDDLTREFQTSGPERLVPRAYE